MNFTIQDFIKLIITVCVIFACSQIGRKLPTLAGLIATMPITSLLVLLWIYTDSPENTQIMVSYSKGALFGIIPSILFFIAAYLCFSNKLSIWLVLPISFASWIVAAVIHQILLK